jgi:putative transposase
MASRRLLPAPYLWDAKKGALDEAIGPNPTDRGRPGTKDSLLVEAQGGPLSLVVAGANVVDAQLLELTLESVIVERPSPEEIEQHLSLDKGYDNPTGEKAVQEHGYIGHIRRIGEEKFNELKEKKYPARRWVVERTLAWLRRCRAIIIRYDRKVQNYLALLILASTLLWYRRAVKMGAF